MLRNYSPALFAVLALGLLLYIGYSLEEYPELKEIAAHGEWDRIEASDYFRELAQEKGAVYAFDVLRRATLPAGVNIHGVGHAVGYVLYAQEGLSGMGVCMPEFRNACSHSLVISAFIEQGANALPDIVQACVVAPGGVGAYEACMHGLGHGLLAYVGYDLPQALTMCKTAVAYGPERQGNGHRFTDSYDECVGGVVMEMSQGAHDEDVWETMAPQYVPVSDPLMPCTLAEMPEEARDACYRNVTERFMVAVGALASVPSPDLYAPAMRFCQEAPTHQDACYGGFGKQFAFYTVEGDTKDPTQVSDQALRLVWEWCGYAGTTTGIRECAKMALDSLFWAGRNGPVPATSFCRVAPPAHEETCQNWLSENIAHFSYN